MQQGLPQNLLLDRSPLPRNPGEWFLFLLSFQSWHHFMTFLKALTRHYSGYNLGLSVPRKPVQILSSDSDGDFENCKLFLDNILLGFKKLSRLQHRECEPTTLTAC